MHDNSTNRYLRAGDIASSRGRAGLLPICVNTWWNWVKAGKAPAGIKLTNGTTVWDSNEVSAFISAGRQFHAAEPQKVAA